jgi:predicted nuclease of predicted toxin-antitoxin system
LLHWLADENIARSTVQMLRDLGHNVKWVVEEGLQGVDDEVIYRLAVAEGRVVLTFDSDFSQMVYASEEQPGGALVLKFKPRDTQECNQRLSQVLDAIGDPTGRLVIVSRYRVRVRPLAPW